MPKLDENRNRTTYEETLALIGPVIVPQIPVNMGNIRTDGYKSVIYALSNRIPILWQKSEQH